MSATALAAAGCGGTTAQGDRQDVDEPKGNFPVEVKSATFPVDQKLAQDTQMKIVVRNAGDKTIPEIAVTVQCDDSKKPKKEQARLTAIGNGSFDRQIGGVGNADKNRPNFVVNTIPGAVRPNTNQKLDPLERSTAYVNTYTLGKLAPNKEVTFQWSVTAVRAGQFRVCYQVAAGLDHKAIATREGGLPLVHEWDGNITNKAPRTGIADDGKTITTFPDTTGTGQ
jgi:hypothetical protein